MWTMPPDQLRIGYVFTNIIIEIFGFDETYREKQETY